MPPVIDNDWSDSDEEELSEVETPVLLGVPDGAIETPTHLSDAAVSHIGGLPAFLPSNEPSLSSSYCKICLNPMELLVQMWCPFEDSPMDRALYVWGCSRGDCQSKDGSVRAWRGLRYNQEYAMKLKVKLTKRAEKASAAPSVSKPNPFSMGVPSSESPFSIGTQVFGNGPTVNQKSTVAADSVSPVGEANSASDDDGNLSDTSSSSEESLLTAMASVTLETSPWKTAPAYPPLYLSTVSEYLRPQAKAKIPAGTQVTNLEDELDSKNGKKQKDISWAFEPYENSLDVDQAFERFAKRVSHEGEQCVRYELNGVPLPFCSDKAFQLLFPAPPPDHLQPVTKGQFIVIPPVKRKFSISSIPRCPFCKSERTFECQLMPNLINVLRKSNTTNAKVTDEQRMKDLEAEIKGTGGVAKKGMEWGTCMVFSCRNDCRVSVVGGEELEDVWREEVVIIQWDK